MRQACLQHGWQGGSIKKAHTLKLIQVRPAVVAQAQQHNVWHCLMSESFVCPQQQAQTEGLQL